MGLMFRVRLLRPQTLGEIAYNAQFISGTISLSCFYPPCNQPNPNTSIFSNQKFNFYLLKNMAASYRKTATTNPR